MGEIISSLENISEILFNSGYNSYGNPLRKTIVLLKEQEPIKPTLSVDTWICSKCGHTLESQELIDDKENPQVLVHEQYEYCPCCGRKVKWDG